MKRRRNQPIRIKADRWLHPKPIMITRGRWAEILDGLGDYRIDLTISSWENLKPPASAKEFASRAVFRISQNRSGGVTGYEMDWRCIHALERGKSASAVYRHGGKTAAMDYVWQERAALFKQWQRLRDDHDRVRFCGRLPFFGQLSRYELARDLGANVVLPDRRMTLLAHREGLSVWDTCHRLAKQSGYREATIGVILEAALNALLLDPYELSCSSWEEGTPRLDLARRRLPIKAKIARDARKRAVDE